jgi:membrane protein
VLWKNISTVVHQPRHGLLVVGLILALWAASSGTSMTMAALDACYDVGHSRSLLKQRLVAMVLTIGVIILLSLVILLVPVASLATHWFVAHKSSVKAISDAVIVVWNVVRIIVAVFVMFTLLALVYRFGPAVKNHFRLFSPGSVFTVAVWVGLGAAFRAYVNHFGQYNQTYGALGGVAILMFFFYLDGVVLLLGAEINTEIDFAMGVARGSNDFRRQSKSDSSDEDGDATSAVSKPA